MEGLKIGGPNVSLMMHWRYFQTPLSTVFFLSFSFSGDPVVEQQESSIPETTNTVIEALLLIEEPLVWVIQSLKTYSSKWMNEESYKRVPQFARPLSPSLHPHPLFIKFRCHALFLLACLLLCPICFYDSIHWTILGYVRG
jgi:hypothetical protein